jgi:oligopeptide transport system ATP-binding protein
MMNDSILIHTTGLKMYFPVTRGIVRMKRIGDIKAVDNVSFDIRRGETLGLVGESGSGKTTIGKCILRLLKPTSGQILLNGEDLVTMNEEGLRRVRRDMQTIFQDPYGSLNPRMKVGDVVGEPLTVHKIAKGKEYQEQVDDLLSVVGLSPKMKVRYPHEFSGGQRQRIAIARALALRPKFIVCDEPVSALDVCIQAQVINLLEELREKFDLTYLFISHDLSVVRHMSDRIAVMYTGKIVEIANRQDLYDKPLHPYTQALLSAVPVPDPYVEETRHRIILEGDIPSPMNPPSGCRFHPRCSHVMPICSKEEPLLKDYGTHSVACYLYD